MQARQAAGEKPPLGYGELLLEAEKATKRCFRCVYLKSFHLLLLEKTWMRREIILPLRGLLCGLKGD